MLLIRIVTFVSPLIFGVAVVSAFKDLMFGFNKTKSYFGLALSVMGLAYYGLGFDGPRSTTSDLNQCLNNQRALDRATYELARQMGLFEGSRIPPSDYERFFHGKVPKCPLNGIYTFGIVGEQPACSLLEHKLLE